MVPYKIGLREYDVYGREREREKDRERERKRVCALNKMVVLLVELPYSLERKVPCPIC